MMNSVGAFMLAATVWPTSTLREMTMPSIGASMTVCWRLTSFWFSDALDCVRLASDDLIEASADRTATWADSSSCGATSLRAARLSDRFSFTFASSSETFRRSRSACARMTLARACSIWVWSSDGSSSATTWPFFTIELKSAYRALMLPDTCDPTCTVFTAWSVPVAPTDSMTSPRATASLEIFTSSPGVRYL